jgi:chemotaxis protein methyltransferase CheR
MNEVALERARLGVVPLSKMQEYTENYIRAGGTKAFSEYYKVKGDSVQLSPFLAENVVFAQHNLVSDRAFNEFHVIVCRNVMIYFGTPLQERVHELFYRSLVMFGILALGQRESLRFTPQIKRYEEIDAVQKLYKKVA